MSVVVLWGALAIGNVAYLAMLATLWRARSKNAAAELVWAIVPWAITVLCVGPTVQHILATG